jgi:hypothetical protein
MFARRWLNISYLALGNILASGGEKHHHHFHSLEEEVKRGQSRMRNIWLGTRDDGLTVVVLKYFDKTYSLKRDAMAPDVLVR